MKMTKHPREPVRVWTFHACDDCDFGWAVCLYAHPSPARVRAWTSRRWPHGLPAGVRVGRLTEEQYLARR